jgi:hypothetical protein
LNFTNKCIIQNLFSGKLSEILAVLQLKVLSIKYLGFDPQALMIFRHSEEMYMYGTVFYLQAEDILEETRGIKRVLDQFQKEKTCEMDIT